MGRGYPPDSQHLAQAVAPVGLLRSGIAESPRYFGGARAAYTNWMMISATLAKAFNEQIGHEFGASMQYVSIAAYFQSNQLTLLAKLFFEQAEEERQHAMKFVKYLLDTKGGLAIPAIPASQPTFASAEAAVKAALTWEQEVTRQITALMEISVKHSDYLAQSFLQWFIDEQLEEVVKMDRLLNVVQRAGEKNLLMVEAYLVHIEKAG